MSDSWLFEPLADGHDRTGFSCGNAALDAFLTTQATQYHRRNLGRTFVAIRSGEPKVAGYYTLAASSVSLLELPSGSRKKLPRHPVPTVLIGRLAVDQSSKGQGLGAKLLVDAMQRALRISDELGVHAVHVHAIDDTARDFYIRFGFVPLADQGHHLYLPLDSIRKAFGT